jgi:peptide/nickel transport system substrate-binding protein/glutathione transport system substrate-binding protein
MLRRSDVGGRLSRRDLLRAVGLTSTAFLATGLLTACGGAGTPAAPAATTAPATVAAPTAPAAGATRPAASTPANAGGAAPSAKAPKRGGILKIALNQEANTVDPHKSRDIAGTHIKGMVYSQLMKYGRDLQIVPDLAERYDNPEPTTYVFYLRKGVKFHDGADLTAEDVVASYERILEPSTGSPVYVFLKGISSVTARDPSTVEFKLSGPQATFLPAIALCGQYIAQKQKIQANVDFETDLVGTGPFKFTSRTPGVETKVERNPNYYVQGQPYLDGISYRPIFDDSARMNALKSGDVDLATYVTWAAMSQFDQTPQLALQSQKAGGFVQIDLRVDRAPLDNPKVRQAISYAIDRDALIKTAASGRGESCFGGPIPSWMWAYDKDLEGLYRYDPAKAKQLIQEAGAQGATIELTTWPTDTELFGRPSVVVATYLKQAGLNAVLKPVSNAEWAQARAEGTYQGLVNGNLYSIPDPDFVGTIWEKGSNITKANRFSDPEIDGWLQQARTITDQAQRKALYDKVQAKALDLVPTVFLFYREQGDGTQKDVQGYQFLGNPGAFNAIPETWLDR